VTNKTWLLKPEPLKVAKTCIQLVQNEIDVKLPLSHPQFLQMLNDYADMMESESLRESVRQLNTLAGDQGDVFLNKAASNNVVQHPSHTPIEGKTNIPANNDASHSPIDESQTTVYQGKTYKRWQGSKEFVGLYRGQARYR
jgi:hypothetical protein